MKRIFGGKNRVLQSRGLSGDNFKVEKSCHQNSTKNGRNTSKNDGEMTSMRIFQLLEKKKYNKVVELLRELLRVHLLACLESFPFKVLNKNIPDTFFIWETLLTKVHNNEEGYIREFPYAACDELVFKIGYVLVHLERECRQEDQDVNQLFLQCRRILKKVFMQYHDIVKNLMKENECVSKALYSMTLHIPIGLDPSTAESLQHSILKEVVNSLSDFEESKERLEELSVENSHICVEVTPHCDHVKNPSHRSLTQIQVQERLYSNQCVLGAVKPIRRGDNLPQLMEMMNTRVISDKEVLAIFSNLRKQFPKITENDPIEPWLRQYQSSIECAIKLLKGIEEELIIKSPNITPPAVPAPVITNSAALRTDDHEQLHILPSLSSISPDPTVPSSLVTVQSTASLDQHNNDDNGFISLSRDRVHLIRPNSAVNLVKTAKLSQSTQSVNITSEREFEETSSVQDIPSNVDNQPIAGIKKKKHGSFRRSLRSSMRRLSSSAGSVSAKKKKTHRTGFDDGEEMLEEAKKDLLEAQETIQSLKKRERELTNRLSEQAQRQLQDSDKFEDILFGDSRPNLVIQRYQELYSQERVEAFDSISDAEIVDNVIIPEFLLDVLKMGYSAAQVNLGSLNNSWKRSLNCLSTTDKSNAFKNLEMAVSTYIRKVSHFHNPQEIIKMVEWDLDKKYGSLPCFHLIMRLESICVYIRETARLTWDLVVQNPPMVLNYSEIEFIPELHTRFHTADRNSDLIINYQWPTLIQERTGSVLYRGVVIT